MTNHCQIITLPLGALDTNCYLVSDEQSGDTLIIDPADTGDFINQTILDRHLTPQAIVLTHGHFDHVLALLEVKLAWNIPIYLHAADNFLLAQAADSALHWLGQSVDPVPPADIDLSTIDSLSVGEFQFTIVHTPGHTPGSICLYNEEVIFTGDTLFKDGIGRTDFRYSDPQLLKHSLQQIFQLPKHLIAYPGHGESTLLHNELHAMQQ